MSGWRTKRDEDLTPEDIAEMRKLADKASPRGPLCDHCFGSGFASKTITGFFGGAGTMLTACPNGCPQPYLTNTNLR